MTIELSKEARKEAIASIERYFRQNMEEPIGNLAAGALLGFFLEEIGPAIYNRAVSEAQERLQARVSELDIEVQEEEFQYWRKYERKGRDRSEGDASHIKPSSHFSNRASPRIKLILIASAKRRIERTDVGNVCIHILSRVHQRPQPAAAITPVQIRQLDRQPRAACDVVKPRLPLRGAAARALG